MGKRRWLNSSVQVSEQRLMAAFGLVAKLARSANATYSDIHRQETHHLCEIAYQVKVMSSAANRFFAVMLMA
jgi:hypothetical protein